MMEYPQVRGVPVQKGKGAEGYGQSRLKQIEEKKYDCALIAKGIPKERICSYGFAFRGKPCHPE